MRGRLILACAACLTPATVCGQPEAEAIHKAQCAVCHDNPTTRAPARETLKLKSRAAILAALVSGSMPAWAGELSAAEKRAVADLLGAPPGTDGAAPPPDTALCADSAPPAYPLAGPRWIGWGADPANTRFQPAGQAGLTAEEVPKLRLKWAVGLPEAITAYAQPAIAGGRLFVGSEKGAAPADLPPAPSFPDGWAIGLPDAVFGMAEDFEVPAEGVVDYQCFTVPTNFTEDRWVQAAEIRQGNRELVHHVVVFVDEPGGSPSRAPGIQMIASAPARASALGRSDVGRDDDRLDDVQRRAVARHFA